MNNVIRTLVLLALTGYIASLIVGNPLHTNEEDDGSRSDQNTLPSFGGYDDDDDDDENEFRCVSNTPCSCSRRARKRSICVENLSARNVCVNGIPIGTLDLFQLPYSYRVSFPLFTRYLLVPFNGTFPGDIVVRGEIIARSVSTNEIDCVSGGPLNITCAEININTSPSKTLNVFGDTVLLGDLSVRDNIIVGSDGDNSVTGSRSLIVGESMTVSSSRSISFGSGNQCSGDDSICGGVANSNTGIFTALFGTNNSASGLGGIIAGKGNQDNGAWGLTVGRDNIVSLVSGGNLIGGELNRIDCLDCIVGGSSNTVNLVNRIGASLVSGIGSSINVPIASAIGFSLNSSTIGGTVVGSCNSPRSDALFTVGTGLIDYNPFGDPFCANYSNGLEVGTDGNTHVHGDLIVKGNTISGSIDTSALSINGTSLEPLSCHSEVNQIESELEGIGCIGNGFTCSTGTAIWGGCTLDPYAPLVVLQESGMLVVGGDTIQQCTWCNIFNSTVTWNGSVSLLCCTGVNLISPPPMA